MTTKIIDGAEAREISYDQFRRVLSDTAASASNRLYGPSGVIRYAVALAQAGGARMGCVVEAATGDEAAQKALEKHPGWKVAYVGPAGDEIRNTDDFAGE